MDTERNSSSAKKEEPEKIAEDASTESEGEELDLDSLKEALIREKEQSERYLADLDFRRLYRSCSASLC